ncbi:MAG: hypothetical protein KC620_20645, partial [Myxococcales bacterium]|nr:hypothetical protein [Myxococcales bacterium]
MLRRLPLLLLLLALPALAGPPKRPKKAPKRPVKADASLNATQRKDFRAAIAEGRTRQKAEDYPAALAAFARALRILPDDPRALQEHGWAAFKAGNLDLAERSTRAAIARTVDAKLLGAAWYNMGRILEAQAISAYKRSLAVRANTTVRER